MNPCPHRLTPEHGSAPRSAHSQHRKAAHLGDALEITVDVDDAESMMQRRFCDQQVRYRYSVPQPVMMGEVALKPERAL